MTRWTATAVLAVVVATIQPVAATAQTSDAVGVVTTIDGRATVARPAVPSPLSLKFKDDVFGRDRISTQENSLVRVLLGGKAILTVRELSEVTISEEPGRAVVTLPSGKVVSTVTTSDDQHPVFGNPSNPLGVALGKRVGWRELLN